MKHLAVMALALSSASAAYGSDGSGMKVSVAVDLLGSFNVQGDTKPAKDKFEPRSVDLLAYGAIDPYFDGTMSMAAHTEGGEAFFEIHEAFIGSDRLLPRSRFRLGQFFLNIGRLGRFHQHEWPVILTPLVHQEFFGNEGLLDSGLEYSILAPLPFYLDVTVGVTNGFVFGHAHNEGKKPREPNQYVHVLGFFSVGDFDFQPGLSYLRRRTAEDRTEAYAGLEITGKLREGRIIKWLTQAEVWQRTIQPKIGDSERTLGGYGLVQYGFGNGITVGLRGDYLTVTSLEDISGQAIENWQQAIVPMIGIKPSEFSHFRLAYNIGRKKDPSAGTSQDQTIQIQSTFVLGAHPAHEF